MILFSETIITLLNHQIDEENEEVAQEWTAFCNAVGLINFALNLH